MVTHPDYNGQTFANDVAVLTLSQPVAGINPVVLSTGLKAEQADKKVIVAGWGSTAGYAAGTPDSQIPREWPDRMQQATLPIVSDASCNQTYGGSIAGVVQLCAGGVPIKSMCQGDSGGPVFQALPKGKYRQIGVNSALAGCGDAYPGIFSQVSAPRHQGLYRSRAGQPPASAPPGQADLDHPSGRPGPGLASVVPDAFNGGHHEVAYWDKGSTSAFPYAQLDTDITTGSGIEHGMGQERTGEH